MEVLIIIALAITALMLLALFCCLRLSGDLSRMEEEQEAKRIASMQKKELS